MTGKKRLFINALIKSKILENRFNATQAALDANYSKKSAAAQGSRLLKDVEVLQAVKDFFSEQREGLEEDRNKTLREVSILAHSDIADIGDIVKVDGKAYFRMNGFEQMGIARKAISSIQVKFKNEKKKKIFKKMDKEKKLNE